MAEPHASFTAGANTRYEGYGSKVVESWYDPVHRHWHATVINPTTYEPLTLICHGVTRLDAELSAATAELLPLALFD